MLKAAMEEVAALTSRGLRQHDRDLGAGHCGAVSRPMTSARNDGRPVRRPRGEALRGKSRHLALLAEELLRSMIRAW